MRHHGCGMPVPAGALVEVYTLVPFRTDKDGPRRKTGIAGVDFVNSWTWTQETRIKGRSLQIDFYRVGRPKGLEILEAQLIEAPTLEDA